MRVSVPFRELLFSTLAGALLVLLTGPPADASGFAVGLHSAKAVGLGGAGWSAVDDPSYNFLNPAGLGQVEGTAFNLNTLVIAKRTTFDADPGEGPSADAEDGNFLIPSVYFSHKLGDDWAIGLGTTAPFGLAEDWPNDWPGRYLVDKVVIRTLFLYPNLAYRLPFSPGLSDEDEIWVGVGAQVLVDGYVKFRRAEDYRFLGAADGTSEFVGRNEDLEVGWSLSFLYRTKLFDRQIRFGGYFASRLNGIEVDGRTTFRGTPAGVDLPSSTDTTFTVDLPLSYHVDLSVEAIPEVLTIHLTFGGLDWRTFDKVVFDFPGGPGQPPDETLDFNWQSGIGWYAGVSFDATDELTVRTGGFWENSVTPPGNRNAIAPAGDLYVFSVGAGYTLENLLPTLGDDGTVTIDVAYMLLSTSSDKDNAIGRDLPGGPAQANGEYESFGHAMVVGLDYRF